MTLAVASYRCCTSQAAGGCFVICECRILRRPVLDNQEAKQHVKCDRRYGEEVGGHKRLTVVVQKGPPPFPGIPAAREASPIASKGSCGDEEPELGATGPGSWALPNPHFLPPTAGSDQEDHSAGGTSTANSETQSSPMPADGVWVRLDWSTSRINTCGELFVSC